MHADTSGTSRWYGVLVIAALLAAFARGLAHDYSRVDDEALVFLNPVQQEFGRRELLEAFDPRASRVAYGLQYTPVVDVSYALDRKLFGDEPGPYRVQALLFHAAAAAALYALLLRLGAAPAAAAVGAAVFALHPLQVEPVVSIAARDTPLAGALVLCAMLAWLQARLAGSMPAYVLSLLLVVFANLSKQSAVVSVGLLAATEWTARRVRRTTLASSGTAALAYAPHAAISLAFAWLGVRIGSREGIVAPHAETLGEQLRLTLKAIGWYAGKLVWPAGLLPAYEMEVPARWLDGTVAAGAFVVAVSAAAFVWSVRHAPLAAFGIAVVAVSLVPGVHGFGTQVVADRYAYLALAGAGALAAWGCEALARRAGPVVVAGALAVCAALGVASFLRAGIWRDDITLFADAAAKEPRSALWHKLLGDALVEAGRGAEGEAELRRAHEIAGDASIDGYCPLPPVLEHLALEREVEGDLAAAEAALASALEHARPGEVDLAAVRLGAFYLRRGDRERARTAYQRGVELAPEEAVVSRQRLAWLDEQANAAWRSSRGARAEGAAPRP